MPFSKDITIVKEIYEDLAVHSQVHGILFQDNASNPELAQKWTGYKKEVLIDFTNVIIHTVKKFRPNALFARNIYSRVLYDPKAEQWFAQDYEIFLKNYDHVIIMAYPQMNRISQQTRWLTKLVSRVKGFSMGIEKTIFKLQTYDWRKEVWIKDQVLLEELRDIVSSGGRHMAYYPDNFLIDKPMLNMIKLEMSTQTYPFLQ